MALVCAVTAAAGFGAAIDARPAAAQFSETNPQWVGVPAVPKVPTASSTFGAQNDPNAQMLVRADELQYDNANNRILAIGNVQIYYKRSTLEADKVVYEQNTKRMRAEGNARFTEADGKVVHGEIIDLTDEFRDGFVDSLQLEAADRTRFAAPRAERQGRPLHGVPERRLHGVRAVQGRSAQAAALAGARDAHHPRRHREDDLLRGREARVPRLPDVLLAVSLDAGPDGQAQDRIAGAEIRLLEHARSVCLRTVFLGARAEL